MKFRLVLPFIKESEGHFDLFPLKIDKGTEPISSRISRFKGRQAKRIEVHNSVGKVVSALNYMYDDRIGYKGAIVNNKIALSEKSEVPGVQDKVIGYLKERRGEAWHRGLLKCFESAECIGLWTYAPMVRTIERPISLDPSGKKIGLTESGTAVSVKGLKLLSSGLRELYCGTACLREPDQEALNKPEKAFWCEKANTHN